MLRDPAKPEPLQLGILNQCADFPTRYALTVSSQTRSVVGGPRW
jgi:hypothetical protein